MPGESFKKIGSKSPIGNNSAKSKGTIKSGYSSGLLSSSGISRNNKNQQLTKVMT